MARGQLDYAGEAGALEFVTLESEGFAGFGDREAAERPPDLCPALRPAKVPRGAALSERRHASIAR